LCYQSFCRLNKHIHLDHRLSLLLGGVVGTAIIAFTAAASLGAFTATITNNANQSTSGTIVLSEGSSTTTCFSTATDAISTNANNCAINLFAGMTNAVPGGTPSVVTEPFENVGSVNASKFTLLTGVCTVAKNSATSPYYGTDMGQSFTLSSALSTSGAITSLPVSALNFSVASGDALTLVSGANSQVFTASAGATAGATSISVTSETPNYAYPTTSTGTDITQGFCGKVDISINNNTTSTCVFPASTSSCGSLSNTATLASLAAADSQSPVAVLIQRPPLGPISLRDFVAR
jgi:hypothetical protein